MQAVVRAVVFDLDGTLVESAPDLHAAAVRMLAGLGRPALDLATVTGFVGNGVGKLVERCLVATGGEDGLQAEALAAFHRHYAAAPTALTRPYEGVADALAALAAAGLPLGVCTNKPEAMARRVLADLDLAAPFGAVVGGDTLPVLKPDPAPLRLCLEQLGLPGAHALYVGDSETDEATARAAGLPFALFTRGYRKRAAESFEARFAFERYADLPGLIRDRLAPA